jgi:hypothetical protein
MCSRIEKYIYVAVALLLAETIQVLVFAFAVFLSVGIHIYILARMDLAGQPGALVRMRCVRVQGRSRS